MNTRLLTPLLLLGALAACGPEPLNAPESPASAVSARPLVTPQVEAQATERAWMVAPDRNVSWMLAGSANLQVTIDDSNDPISEQFFNFSYTVSMLNLGPNAADNVTVTVHLPSQAFYQGMSAPPGWNCNPQGGITTWICTIAQFSVNVPQAMTFNMLTNGTDDLLLLADASITSSTADPTPANNSDAEETVVGPNDPPVATAPGPQSTPEDVEIIFAGAKRFSIADPDAFNRKLRVTLDTTGGAAKGTMTLSQTTGLIFTKGDGVADASMQFEGALPNINAALDGMRFTPAANYYGGTGIVFSALDLGNSGLGGVKSDGRIISIEVTPNVNDPPEALDDTFAVPGDAVDYPLNVLANDTYLPDPPETLTIISVTQPANGTVAFTASGVTFTPTFGFRGTTTFTYTIADGNGAFDTATVTCNVSSPNNPPTAGNDSYTVVEDSAATTMFVLGNDSTAPDTGETLTITEVTQPAGGTVTFLSDRVTFKPSPNFFGTTTFTYTISDGRQGTATGTVTVTVTGVNDPPTVANDTFMVLEDTPTALSVLANDTYLPDGVETLTITAVTQPANGAVSITGSTITYTPPPEYSGTTTFTYTISDGNGGTATGTVTVNVQPVNDPPVATADSFTVNEDSAATTFNVLANDSTAPETGETLTITSVTQPADGSVSFSATNVQFTPTPNFFGTTSFTYTISDGNGGTATATVTVTVTPLNDAPDAVNDAFAVGANTSNNPLNVLANDTYLPDGVETLTITAVTQAAKGTVTFTASSVSFTPTAGFLGPTSFTYTISDGNGGTDTATVTVTVGNNPPTANADTFTVAEDSGNTTFSVLANDSTAPDTGETLSIISVTQPANASVTFTGASVTFKPALNYNGPTSFTYTVSDGNGGTATATVTVTVTPVNDPPTATNDSFQVNRNSGATTFDVMANDSSAPDGAETLTITAVTQPANGTVTMTAANVSFTPAANFEGPTTFTYTISDGNGGTATATVTVNVQKVNAPPDAVDDTFAVAEDSPVSTFNVLANDSSAPDVGETLTVTAVTQPANGTVTFNASTVRFTPAANFNGPTSFTYTISDGNNGSDTATVTVNVTPVNDPPDAVNDTFVVDEDSSANPMDVLANDSTAPDTGETLTISAVTQSPNGTVTLTGGVVRFTPAPGFSGPTTFTYTVSDGNGGSDTAQVTVTVNHINHPPVANNDSFSVLEDSSATKFSVLTNDSTAPDTGETLTITAVTQPANGTVTFMATSVFFTPAPNFNGPTTFTYTVSDGNGGTATATVTVTVDPVNDLPVANADSFTVAEDSTANPMDVLANDTSAPDTGETLTVLSVTQSANGTVTLTGGVVRFAPAPNFNGPTTFTYTVSDGNGGTATATVTVNVTPVNDLPVANNDSFTVAEDSGANALDVLANDSANGDQGETLTVTAVTQPASGGTVSFTASNVTFTPAQDFNGPVTFTYTISDGNGGNATATVTVNVTPVNEAPTANDDSFMVAEDSSATQLDVLTNDTFAPDVGETLTITAATQPANGTVTYTATHVFFTPAANFHGPTTFTYTVSDGNGGTDQASVTVTVTPVNDDPTATDDTFVVAEDSSATVLDVLANDSFAPDVGETLTITSVTQPTNGTVTFTASNVSFAPANNFSGATTFSYRISDGNGATDTATVTVTVTPVNDPPDAKDDSITVAEDSSATVVNVLANDSIAPDTGETLTVTAVTQPAGGTVTFTASNVSFAPAANFNGPTSFTYTISDGNNGSDTATVTVTVTPVNDAPTANDDSFTVAENSGATVLNVLANDTAVPDTGETLTITTVTQPANGTVGFTGSNVTFTPAASFVGPTTFTYTISDGNGGTATATVTVNVTNMNDPPTATDDTFVVAEDSGPSALDVLANDSFAPDTGETLTVTAVTQPSSGTVSFAASNVTFTPAQDFNGTVTFSYTISDGNNGSATATVTVTVTPVNDPPTTGDDSFTVGEDSVATVLNVLANDSTAPETNETLTITAATQPANGTVTFTGTSVLFTPASNFNGPTSFQYTVSDGNGGSATATVTVTVTPVNDPPDAVNDTLSVAENSVAAPLDVLANDSSAPDVGETLTVTKVTQPASGTVTLTGGVVRYTPPAGFNGTVTFTYTISDGNNAEDTASVTVTVTPVNDPPVANADSFTVAEDSSATVLNVLANDSTAPDTGETLTVQSVTQPANGTVTLTSGVVSFTPAPDFNGPTSFQYTVSDGNSTATATVTVTVAPVNDDPAANDDSITVAEDSSTTTINVLANDSIAPDTGETLTVQSVTQPAGGTVTFTAANVFFTPAAQFNGTATFTYRISDGNGGSDTATVTVTVTPVNDAPTANDDSFQIAEDSGPNVLDVLFNDSSAPDTGETLTVVSVTQPAPANGTVSFTGSNVSFTPVSNFVGTVSFTYTLSDGNGINDTAVVTVTVTPVNDDPTANNDNFLVAQDSVANTLDVLANDTAVPDTGETLIVTSVTQPASGGTVSFTGSNVSFTPAAGFAGSVTFTYTISDGNGGTDSGTVTVLVGSPNNAPKANADSYTVAEDSGASVLDVLANDSFAPDTGETLTVTAVTQPISGTVSFTASNVTFTPAQDFNGTVTFSYTISDGNNGAATATVTVVVTPVNDAPMANDDAFSVAEDSLPTVLDVLTNDSIVPDSGESLMVTAVTQPANGTVTVSGGVVRFTPAPDYHGPTSFQYTVSDGNGGNATATVTVMVTPVNDGPDAVNDSVTVAEDSPATVVNVLANDTTTPDVGETLTVTAVTQPANGTVTFTGTNVSFTPAPNFNGTTSFQYTVSDGNGGTDQARVTVTVTPVNDDPTANNDSFAVAINSPATVLDVLFNDSSAPDTGETLTITAVTQPSSGGSVSVSGGGVRFTPAADFTGTVTFTYTISDGNGGSATATVTVTVSGTANNPPVAVDDSFTVAEDSAATPMDVLANDTSAPDVGETLTVTAVTQPAGGSVTFTATGVSFTPAANFSGTTTFKYAVSDGNGGTVTATVTVTVTPENDAPTANDDAFAVAEDSGPTVFDVLANDSSAPDTGETLTVQSVTQPSLGGSVALTAGVVRFSPTANFNGTVTFTYTLSDGNGGSATATVTVTVKPVNDAPRAQDDAFTVPEDFPLTAMIVLENDTAAPDSGETLTITSVTQPARGMTVLVDGLVYFAPEPEFFGTTTFTYTVSDGNGGTASATVTMTVTPENDPPTANNDAFKVAVNSSANVMDVLVNDTYLPDPPETLTITGVVQPASGSVTLIGGVVRFTPAPNFSGTTTFTYTISDGNGEEDTGTVTVTVSGTNNPPTAENDNYTVDEDSAATVLTVLANDSTAPDTGETLTVQSVTQPANGTVTLIGGVVRFTPAPNFNGITTFTYTVSDGNDGTEPATVTVTVNPVNDVPDAVDDSYFMVVNSPAKVLDVLANDSMAPDTGETLTVQSVTQPASGGSVVLSGGVVSFTPAAGFSGTATFTYTISDGNGGEDTATVTVTVMGINTLPVANDDSFTVPKNSPATALDVLANDSTAPDTGETLTVTAATQPASGGTVALTSGVVTFTPTAGFTGTVTFTYTISDGNGGNDTAMVTVTVTGTINNLPVANDDEFTVDEDWPATVFDVLANDTTAPDTGETLTIISVTQPANGTVTFTGTNVSFTPAANYNGNTVFTYTVSDGNGGSAMATVRVVVSPVNDLPVANDDTLTVAEDSPATAVDVLANDTTAPDVGESILVKAVSQPASGGTAALNAGVVEFTPAANFNGTTSFAYTISDGNGGEATATVTVTVTPVNDLPTAMDDSLTVDEDSPATPVDVLTNDSTAPDTGETLTVQSVTQPASGGSVTLTTGVVSFTPAANFNGTTSFTYTVSDGNGGEATATVTVTVKPVNDLPTATDDSLTVDEDSPATVVDVLANDSFAPDTGETLTVTAVGQPATGGSVALNAGAVEFTPAANFNGTTSFTYTVSDGNGGEATATVTVTVKPVNDLPDAVDDTFTVAQNSAATVLNVLANDSFAPDSGETLTVQSVTQPASGGSVTLAAGVVSFTPAAGFSGTVTFQYTISDGNGGEDTATVTVTVTDNNPPVAVDDSLTVSEDSLATVVDVLTNDSTAPDTGETLTVQSVTQPANGTVTLTAGVVEFTPAANFNGTTSFTYTVSDGNGGTDTATVTVTVTPVNDPPTGVADSFTIDVNAGPQNLDVLANDSIAPDTGETLTVTDVTQPISGGTVTIATGGTGLVFTPSAGFTGTAAFTYTVSDGNGGTAVVDVTVSVTLDTDGDGLTDVIELATGTDPNDDDTDDDGFMDGSEDRNHNGSVDSGETDPRKFDTDNDGLSDGLELGLTQPEGKDTNASVFKPDLDPGFKTDPNKADTDGGGVFDGVEDRNGNGRVDPRELDPNDPTDDVDADGDGVDNDREEEVALDPFDNDSDDDGVMDGEDGLVDTDTDGTINALDADSDNDGLLDGTERGVVATSAPSGTDKNSANFRADADPASTTNPLVADTDGDTLKDGEEDANHNGLIDTQETDPNKMDTDDDALSDGVEVKGENATDPTQADTDGDELKDGEEDINHDGRFDSGETNPNDPDTDDGGAGDGAEFHGGTDPLDDTDDFVVAGSGCASTGASSLMPLVLLLGLPLLRRRRAVAGAERAPRAGAWGMLGMLAVLVAAQANAQSAPSPTSSKIDVQQYKPGPGAYDVLGLQSAKVGRHLGWNLGLSVSYAKDPLTFLDPREDTVVYRLVENQMTVDLMGAISFLDRFELGLALPITTQTSQSAPTVAPLFDEGVGKTGLGDVRVVPKARLYSTGGLSLGAALPIHLPTGGSENFLGGGFSVRPRLLGEWGSSGGARVLANVGLNLRSKEQLRNLVVSNELTYGLGAELPFKVGGRELAAGGTLMGAMGLGQKGGEEKPLEVLATVKYRFSNAIAAHLGGGPGLTQGYGTPGFRVFAGLAYVAPVPTVELKPTPKVEEPKAEAKPRILDSDGDGLANDQDKCPTDAEDKDGFEDADGCPDMDNDADGTLDSNDICPNEPETKNNFQEEDGCPDQAPPPPDTDGDGLVDPSDLCPQAVEDKDGFEDTDGCPDVDNDRDGVADAADKCPAEPETINGVKDEDGCPDKGKVKVLVEGEKIVILEKIFFANNKATILPKSFPLLKQVAQVLKGNAQIEKVRVEGHTDDKGDDGANLVLSRSRAEAVRDRLVMEGIEAGRLEAVGYGEARPVASSKTNKGREQNRRVEFVIVKVKAKEIEVEQP